MSIDLGGGQSMTVEALRALMLRVGDPARSALARLLPDDPTPLPPLRVITKAHAADHQTEFCVWLHPSERLYACAALVDGRPEPAAREQLERRFGPSRFYAANEHHPAILHLGSRS